MNKPIAPMTKKGTIIFKWLHPRIETLPNNQPIICLSSSPVKAIIKEINDPKKELKITPVKIIVSTRIARSILSAKINTINTVTKALIILKKGKEKEPNMGIDKLKKIVITAPTEAPEETPRVKGSASGLRKRP